MLIMDFVYDCTVHQPVDLAQKKGDSKKAEFSIIR